MLHAVFTDGVGAITVQGLTQWDKGQQLRISLSSLPAAFQTHFSNKGSKTAYVVECASEGGVATVPIPNIILQQDKDAIAYVYINNDETGETIKTIHLPIVPRSRPADYVYEEIDLVDYKVLKKDAENALAVAEQAALIAQQASSNLAEVREAADAAAERAEAAASDVEAAVSDAAGAVREQVAADANRAEEAAEIAENAANTAAQDAAGQVVQNLGGYVTNAQNAAQSAETAKSAAQTAQAAAEKAAENASAAAGGGVTSFNGRGGAVTPQKGDYNAEHITFSDGETFQKKYDSGELKGAPGDPGTSVTVTKVTESTEDGGSNVVTFSDGKTLNVKNGSKGNPGDPGKTPVKGTDYFTAADKTEMVNAVLANFTDVSEVGM